MFSSRSFEAQVAAVALFVLAVLARVGAQTVLTINNPSFESPLPTVFPDYTVGATDWTRTRNDVDAGTFSPAMSGVTPAPTHGVQAGYANGSGGLQQVLSTGFPAGYNYTFSVYIGYRSDEANAPHGNGAIQLGYLDGASAFVVLATRAATPMPGQFNFISGTYEAAVADQGKAITMRLIDTASVQVLFDQVQLTAAVTAIPEPARGAAVVGATTHGQRAIGTDSGAIRTASGNQRTVDAARQARRGARRSLPRVWQTCHFRRAKRGSRAQAAESRRARRERRRQWDRRGGGRSAAPSCPGGEGV